VLGLSEAVQAGTGIGPLPCFIADSNPDLVRLSDINPDFSAGLWLLTHPDLRQSARVRAFMDFMAAEIAKQKRWIEGAGRKVAAPAPVA
jgi:DNA-binding transcriptional LysR family regulator